MARLISRPALIAYVLWALWVPAASAQDASSPEMRPATLFELVLLDGSRMYGTVERESPEEIVFTTHVGVRFTVRRADIASLRKISGAIRADEFLPPDPNTTRLFFAPTARTLRRGQAYLGVYEFMMPFVQVGLTDRVSIGGGTPLMIGLENGDRPFWVTPKVQVLDRHGVQASVGLIHVFAAGGDGAGIAYAVATRGTEVRSFTAGAGLGYTTDGGRAGVMMVGGEARVARRLKAITENYIWEGGNGFVSAGFRFFGERLSAGLGLAVPLGTDDFYALPLVDFVYVF